MPNTLVHIGIHLPITRGIFPGADPKWILLGCVVPDLPWIFQRAARFLLPAIPPIDLRLYAAVQASFFFCLVFSAGAAPLSRRPLRTFTLLALGSGLHLFLDALQIKWGNGVHFFAPFSWRMTQFGLFWPESPVTDFFTLTGLGILVFFGFRNSADAPAPRHGNQAKAWAFAALILAGYFFSPLALLSGPERANNHFAATLRNREDRLGKPIALDRASWRPKEGLRVFSGDVLVAEGLAGVPAGAVSLQGRFTAPDRIRVRRWHIHRPGIRDLASYIGLLGVAGAWGWGAAGFRRCKEKGPNAG